MAEKITGAHPWEGGKGVETRTLEEVSFLGSNDSDLMTKKKAMIYSREQRKKNFQTEYGDPESDFNKRLHALPEIFQRRFEKLFKNDEFWDYAKYELEIYEIIIKFQEAAKDPSFREKGGAERIALLFKDNPPTSAQSKIAETMAISLFLNTEEFINLPMAIEVYMELNIPAFTFPSFS